MEYTYKALKNIIEINAANGLPSELLWSINEKLCEKYELYEYFYNRSEHISPNPSFTIKTKKAKYIHFFKLHEMYLKRENITEEELILQHKELAPEMSYDNFKRTYGVEFIETMEYFTIRLNEESWENKFKERLLNIKNENDLRNSVLDMVDVLISINDHREMTIRANNENILREIETLIANIKK